MSVPIEVDIPCDPTQIDHTGLPWTFLDEAAHPDRIVEGAIVITGDAEDPVFARVASLTERPTCCPRNPSRPVSTMVRQLTVDFNRVVDGALIRGNARRAVPGTDLEIGSTCGPI